MTRVSCFLDSERLPFVVLNYAAGKKTGSWEGQPFVWKGPFVFQPVFHLKEIRNLSLCGDYGKGERVSYLSARQFFPTTDSVTGEQGAGRAVVT